MPYAIAIRCDEKIGEKTCPETVVLWCKRAELEGNPPDDE